MVEKSNIVVEVCAASVEVAVAAQNAGADRIELNVGLELDGLTPSPGLVAAVLDKIQIPVIAMVRPRGGDFVYSDFEWQIMLDDARWLMERGCAGLAFGCIDHFGNIDLRKLAQFRERVPTGELVFHRAFDEVADPDQGIQQLVDAGVDRIMSSGGASRAEQGMDRLARLVRSAEGRIGVLPASGIVDTNVVPLIEQTGVDQVHGTFGTSKLTDLDQIGRQIASVVDVCRSWVPAKNR